MNSCNKLVGRRVRDDGGLEEGDGRERSRQRGHLGRREEMRKIRVRNVVAKAVE